MTDLLSSVEAPSDAELISRVRGGDVTAYGELFSRHVEAAKRLGRQLAKGPDVDDLVSEAFAKVLQVLQGGGGPDVAFRAYLLTAVRRLHVDRVRATAKLQTSDDMTQFDPGVPFRDTAVEGFESGAAAKAFASLPERWQLVLWHLEVEGQKPADIAPLLGMSANSVSALAYRAREGLRQAYLTMHLADTAEAECRWVNEHLGAYVRKGLSRRDSTKVESHLDECRKCMAMYLELTEVNSNLAGIIAPLLLGAAATGYVASSGGAAAGGVLALLGNTKEWVTANSQAAVAGAVAAGVAAVAVSGFLITRDDAPAITQADDEPRASAPADPGGTTPAPDQPGDETDPSDRRPDSSGQNPSTPEAELGSTIAPAAVLPPATPPSPTVPNDGIADPGANGGTEPGANGGTDPGANGGPDQPGSGSTDGPGTAEPVATNVSFAEAEFSDQGVDISLQGDPVLPPSVSVALTSNPGGITFDPARSDCVISDGGTVATCQVSHPFGRSATAAADVAFSAHFAFAIPETQLQTEISLSVSVPKGYRDTEDNTSKTFTFKPDRDFVFTALTPRSVSADADKTYHLTGDIKGLPANGGDATFFVDGAAAFAGSSTEGCDVRPADTDYLDCRSLVDGEVDFRLRADDSSFATQVDLILESVRGFDEKDPDNNRRSATLLPTHVDIGFTQPVPDEPKPDSEGLYTLTTDLSGVDGLAHITFAIRTGPASFVASASCTPAADGKQITCDSPDNGQVVLLLEAAIDRPTEVTIDLLPPGGWTETADSDNSRVLLLQRGHLTRDLDLSAAYRGDHKPQVRPMDVTVFGAPSGELTFTIKAGGNTVFKGGTGCEVSDLIARCNFDGDGVFAQTFMVDVPPGQVDKTLLSVTVDDNTDPVSENSSEVLVAPPIGWREEQGTPFA